MERIDTRARFVALASELGVRADWHEPDEQEVSARVEGSNFGNAGFWPADQAGRARVELHVVLTCEGRDVACVNLATLCAWASGLRD